MQSINPVGNPGAQGMLAPSIGATPFQVQGHPMDQQMPSGLQNAIGGPSSMATGSPLQAAIAPPQANLGDPSQWMGMVHNPQALDAYVAGKMPGADQATRDYYKSKIVGQPGANPTEQAGGDTYWTQKMQHPEASGRPQAPSMFGLQSIQPTQLMDNTGSNNPLLNAIRNQMMKQGQQ